MKKVGEIMKDMGFNPEASEGTQKAFIKYLLRVANKNKHVPEPLFYDEAEKDEQLCFPFDEKKSDSEAS